MKIRSKSRKKRIALLSALVIVLIAGAGTAFAATQQLGPFSKPKSTANRTSHKDETSDTTTDNEETDTSDVDPKVEDNVKNGGNSGQGESDAGGGASDTGGSDVGNESGGASSKSGNITLYSPGANQKLSNGATIKGSAKVPTVFYRLSDNINGMIGSGQLSVKNGKFSGKLSASTSASSGLFEVYSLNSQGQEVNNIKLNVKY